MSVLRSILNEEHVTVPIKEPSRHWTTTDKTDKFDSFVAPSNNKVETSLEAVNRDGARYSRTRFSNCTNMLQKEELFLYLGKKEELFSILWQKGGTRQRNNYW